MHFCTECQPLVWSFTSESLLLILTCGTEVMRQSCFLQQLAVANFCCKGHLWRNVAHTVFWVFTWQSSSCSFTLVWKNQLFSYQHSQLHSHLWSLTLKMRTSAVDLSKETGFPSFLYRDLSMWGKRGCHPAYDTQQESRKRLSSKQTVFLGILSSGRFFF